MILIPVKNLANAKQRLASLLDQPTRTELARTMLSDVLERVAEWSDHPQVSLVTSDPFAMKQAEKLGFGIIPDHDNKSETDAIEKATKVCLDRGIDNVLVLPADIPLIQQWELEKIYDTAPNEGSVLVPSASRRGTNGAWRRPANLFPLKFGDDSFRPHLGAARLSRKPCVVLTLPGIALDIDTPEDLQQLIAAEGDTLSQKLAINLNLADLPRAASL